MVDKAELTMLRHRISDGLKGDMRMLDFKCCDCEVGIDNGSETFVITPDDIKVWCQSCKKDHDV